jgi:hydroxypyruvate reductase
MFDAAIASAQPARCIAPHLPDPKSIGRRRLVVLGAGKASAAMAQAVENHWDGDVTELVVTRYGHAAPCSKIEIVEAAHPVPDEAGLKAAERVMQLAAGLTVDDFVLCLISGAARPCCLCRRRESRSNTSGRPTARCSRRARRSAR